MPKQPPDHFPPEYRDGYVEFFFQKFLVNGDVLIPRYETETLVRRAINHCKHDKVDTLIDIGTGSGNILLSIACNTNCGRIIATDISHAALAIAKVNADRLLPSCIDFFQGDLLTPLSSNMEMFDRSQRIMITANLPYVGSDDEAIMSPDTAYEPRNALYGGGSDGLDTYRRFFHQLQRFQIALGDRNIGCHCLIEFGINQREITERALISNHWKYAFFSDERAIPRFAQIRCR